MKEELLNKLSKIARGTIIALNGSQYVKDTVIGSKKTYWFNIDGDDKLTSEEVVEIILKIW